MDSGMEMPVSCGLTGSGSRRLSERFSGRGLRTAVQNSVAEQEKREEETRAMLPEAYRLSGMDERAAKHYRNGKENMSSEDLIGYFAETRALRIRNADFSVSVPAEETIEEGTENEKAPLPAVRREEERRPGVLRTLRALPTKAVGAILENRSVWFNGQATDTSGETRRFPFSAFAAILAVAVSMMLIVAASVLVSDAERDLQTLNRELTQLHQEVSEMKSELSVQNDLSGIRTIATEEYGMVDKKYVKMDYISVEHPETAEAFPEERESGVGLSALLSALGIK